MPSVRCEFQGSLELLAPLHVGSGEFRRVPTVRGKEGANASPEVAAILRDHRGAPFVPGSTWKGLFRRLAEEILEGDGGSALIALFGAAKDSNAEGNMAALTFRGASATGLADAAEAPFTKGAEPELGPGVFVAARTKLDDRRGVADEHHLFHHEMVAAGAVFPLKITLEADAAANELGAMKSAVVGVLKRLTEDDGEAIGKGQADGFGRVRLKPGSVKIAESRLGPNGWSRPSDATSLWTAASPRRTVGRQQWRFKLHCDGPFVILDSSRKARRGAGSKDDRTPQLYAQRIKENLPLLLGASLSGALRARARWLAALHFKEKTEGETLVDSPARIAELTSVQRLFGVTGFRGRLGIRNLSVDQANTWNISSVKLDRFSGGPIDNALFTTATFVGTRIAFTLELSPRGKPIDGDPDLELAKRLASDIEANGLVLGHGGNKGFGWFEPEEARDAGD